MAPHVQAALQAKPAPAAAARPPAPHVQRAIQARPANSAAPPRAPSRRAAAPAPRLAAPPCPPAVQAKPAAAGLRLPGAPMRTIQRTIQRHPSSVADFRRTFSGSLERLRRELAADGNVQQVFKEQFPGKDFSLFFDLFGISELEREESAQNYKDTAVTLLAEKSGDHLNIDISHAYIHPFQNILYFTSQVPYLELKRWFKEDFAPIGMGFRLFQKIREAALALGMKHIQADAIGDPMGGNPENGYYTWVRYGFSKNLGELGKFLARAGELWSSRLKINDWKLELAQQETGLPPEATSATLSSESALRDRLIQVVNARVFQREPHAGPEEEYIALKLKILTTEASLARHSAALQWLSKMLEEATTEPDISDLFLLTAKDPGMRSKLAQLWKDLGEAVHNAVFDLSPSSPSSRVLAIYKEEVETTEERKRSALMSRAMLYGWSHREVDRQIRGGDSPALLEKARKSPPPGLYG